MLIEEAVQLINEMSVKDLKSLNRDELMFIVDGMTVEERGRFFMEKNVKVFGGIDGYVTDFLDKVKLNSMNTSGKTGAKVILNKMLAYPGISEASKKRVQEALMKISYETAPAAGGRRKTRKARGLKRTRVRR
jgi:hypothetical protein